MHQIHVLGLTSGSYCACIQAWNIPAAERVGRRSELHNSMSYSSWLQIYVQVQHHRPRRHPLVACPLLNATGHRIWRADHKAESWDQSLPIPQTSQGNSHHVRYVVQNSLVADKTSQGTEIPFCYLRISDMPKYCWMCRGVVECQRCRP